MDELFLVLIILEILTSGEILRHISVMHVKVPRMIFDLSGSLENVIEANIVIRNTAANANRVSVIMIF